MITKDHIEQIPFHDGEGFDELDLEALQRLVRRHMYTDLVGAMGAEAWLGGALASPQCRPFGDALAAVHVPGTATVRLNGGFFLFAAEMDPGQPSPHAIAHRIADATFDAGTSSANAAGSDRHDLVTVAMQDQIEDSADQVSRFFEDAATRVKTAQTFVKRQRARATFQIYEGTPGGGDPAVPGTEVAIARYIMRAGDSTYADTDIEDLRTPAIWPAPSMLASGELPNAITPVRLVPQAEGTWTPGLLKGGVAHNSFSSRRGTWVQTGNVVVLSWSIVATSFSTSAATQIDLTGMPAGFLNLAGFFRFSTTGPLNGVGGSAVPEHYPVTNLAPNEIRLHVTNGNTVANWPATSVITGQLTALL